MSAGVVRGVLWTAQVAVTVGVVVAAVFLWSVSPWRPVLVAVDVVVTVVMVVALANSWAAFLRLARGIR